MITVKNAPKVDTERTLSGINYGTIFSGTIDNVTGIFLTACDGIFRLDETDGSPFGWYFCRYRDPWSHDNPHLNGIQKTVSNYKELKSELVITNAKV